MIDFNTQAAQQALWEIERLVSLYWICKEMESEDPEKVDGTDGLMILEIQRRIDQLKAAIPAA